MTKVICSREFFLWYLVKGVGERMNGVHWRGITPPMLWSSFQSIHSIDRNHLTMKISTTTTSDSVNNPNYWLFDQYFLLTNKWCHSTPKRKKLFQSHEKTRRSIGKTFLFTFLDRIFIIFIVLHRFPKELWGQKWRDIEELEYLTSSRSKRIDWGIELWQMTS